MAVKCKYAHDPSDALCKDCNGEYYMENHKRKDCSECLGYEPSEETTEEIAKEEPKIEEIKPKNTTDMQDLPFDTDVIVSDVDTGVFDGETINNTIEPENATQNGTDENTGTLKIETSNDSSVIITPDSVTVECFSGASISFRTDMWYKFECRESRTYNRELTDAQVDTQRDAMFDRLNTSIDAQMNEVLKNNKN